MKIALNVSSWDKEEQLASIAAFDISTVLVPSLVAYILS